VNQNAGGMPLPAAGLPLLTLARQPQLARTSVAGPAKLHDASSRSLAI
jgi:hypothetical protein